jgi:ssDNA-binding replication factor A large subunit
MVSHILDSAEDIIKKILGKGISSDEVKDKIKKKQDEYGGLLTEAGAAYSIAKELGIDFEANASEAKVKDLSEGQPNVNLTVKVDNIFPLREFDKDGRKGTVTNLAVSDDTGRIAMVIWNKDKAAIDNITKGSTIRIVNAYVRQRENGLELNAGNLSVIEVIGEGKDQNRIKIRDLQDSSFAEIRATIVDVFKPTILEICPNCGSMLKPDCPKCGKTGPSYSLIVNAELDDGTDVIRGTFYRQTGERLLSLSGKELKERPELFEGKRRKLLGEEYIFIGETKFDQSYNRMNFIVRSFNNMDVQKELARC